MEARFSFSVDRRRGLVRITMAGFLSHRDVAAFLEGRKRAHAELGWPPNSHVTLNDLRGLTAQPQTIIDAFEEVLADMEYRSRRLAFVAGPTMIRAQVFRALATREARCFPDPAQAEAWLFDEGSALHGLRRQAG